MHHTPVHGRSGAGRIASLSCVRRECLESPDEIAACLPVRTRQLLTGKLDRRDRDQSPTRHGVLFICASAVAAYRDRHRR